MQLRVERAHRIGGELRPPGDKSLTHRAYMFAAIAEGQSVVREPLQGEDCDATLSCLAQLGARASRMGAREVSISGSSNWVSPKDELYCGNSGTTMRLLSGLIASRPITATLTGDASLSRRPMKRIAEPLRLMGAEIEGDTPPLLIHGGELEGISYDSPVASAQIKSCVLLAGLRARGSTKISEPSLSRDHTERMLSALGVPVEEGTEAGGRPYARIEGGAVVQPFEITVPGDISSAAFVLVAASLLPGSDLLLRDVGVNPSRTGILDVLLEAGVDVQVMNSRSELGEPVADLGVSAPAGLKPFEISGALVPRLIDEIPVLAVLATQCEGTSVIRDARELRVKESDRIELIASGLRAMGAAVETFEDGFAVTGKTSLRGATIESHLDHRIGMAFAIAGLIAEGTTTIEGADAIATSFPNFESELRRLTE